MKRIFTKDRTYPFDIYTDFVKPKEGSITHTLGTNPEIILVPETIESVPERIGIIKSIYKDGTSALFLGQFPDEKSTMAYSLPWGDPLVKKCYGKMRDKEFILITMKHSVQPDAAEERIKVSTNQRFVIFSAGWNSEEYIARHIRSVVRQNYPNYLHIVVDDATTDRTSRIIKRHAHSRMVVYRNKKNMKWVWNALEYLPRHIESNEDVVVVVDLDDWLASKRVLTILANAYEREKCWVTYGSFVYNTNISRPRPRRPKVLKSYPPQVIKDRNFRKVPWMWWHPKTFKFFLFDAIKEQDLYAPDGRLPLFTYDKAIGFPILEMTPPGKMVFIKDVLYVYNIDNPERSSRTAKRGGGLGGWYRRGKGKKPYGILKR